MTLVNNPTSINDSNPESSLCILLVIPWSAKLKGGVSTVVRNLASTLGATPGQAAYVISDWKATGWSTDEAGETRFCFSIFDASTLFSAAKSLVSSPLRLFKQNKVLASHAIDVINFHYPGTDAFGVCLLKRFGFFKGKVILSFHGTDVKIPDKRVESMVWRYVLSSADHVTACSNALASKLTRELLIPTSKISVLLNGYDRSVFKPASALCQNDTVDIALPRRYITSIGSFIARKGHATLLDAFAIIRRSHPDIELVICGMDGPELSPLRLRAEHLGVLESVHLLTDLEAREVAHVMRNSVAVIQPSLAEPFGLALIEAGACEATVLATEVGGHKEILSHGKTGLLFPVGDVSTLANMLDNVLENPDEANRLAHALKEVVSNTYSWNRCARDLLAIAKHVIEDRP